MPFQTLFCRESAKKKDVRTTNIESAKAVADAVRTSLGPRGMDKMVRALLEVHIYAIEMICSGMIYTWAFYGLAGLCSEW